MKMSKIFISLIIIITKLDQSDDDHVDGVRLRLWTAATKRAIVFVCFFRLIVFVINLCIRPLRPTT
jgi:hypothetical protein